MSFESLVVGLSVTTIILIIGYFAPEVFSVILAIFSWAKDFFSDLIAASPIFLRMILFLFLLSFVIGGVVNTVTDSLYVCYDGVIYKPTNIYNGFAVQLAGWANSLNVSQSQYESLLANTTVVYKNPSVDTPEGLFQVGCRNNNAVLTLMGLDIFSYRIWLLVLICFGIFKTVFWMKGNK